MAFCFLDFFFFLREGAFCETWAAPRSVGTDAGVVKLADDASAADSTAVDVSGASSKEKNVSGTLTSGTRSFPQESYDERARSMIDC